MTQHRTSPTMNFLKQYRALFSKMFFSSLRNKWLTIAEIFFAIMFIGLLLGLRYIFDNRHYDERSVKLIPVPYSMDLNNSGGNITYYYPGTF